MGIEELSHMYWLINYPSKKGQPVGCERSYRTPLCMSSSVHSTLLSAFLDCKHMLKSSLTPSHSVIQFQLLMKSSLTTQELLLLSVATSSQAKPLRDLLRKCKRGLGKTIVTCDFKEKDGKA